SDRAVCEHVLTPSNEANARHAKAQLRRPRPKNPESKADTSPSNTVQIAGDPADRPRLIAQFAVTPTLQAASTIKKEFRSSAVLLLIPPIGHSFDHCFGPIPYY